MENIDNIIIEHLKALRNDLKEFRLEAREELQIIRMRLNSVERTVAGRLFTSFGISSNLLL